MATMLGSAIETVATAGDLSTLSVENALENALPECEQCLQKLNSLPDVQNNFKVELEKGLLNVKSRFGKDERRQIISTVCQVNRAIYDAKKTLSKDRQIWIWPSVDTGEDKINPLRDGRVAKVLEKVGTEHSCIGPLSFGHEGQKKNRLKRPVGIATNTDDQFIVADAGDDYIKVFDCNSNFLLSVNTRTNDAGNHVTIYDVATDENSKIYALVAHKKPGDEDLELKVQVFNSTGELLLTFPTGSHERYNSARLLVTNNKVLVLRRSGNRHVVDAYDHVGDLLLHFAEETPKSAADITTGNGGQIIILCGKSDYIRLFTDDGKYLSTFHMNAKEYYLYTLRIACHPEGEHIVVSGKERSTDLWSVSIYTKDFHFVRKITLHEYQIQYLEAITVTRKDHFAVAVIHGDHHGRIIVL